MSALQALLSNFAQKSLGTVVHLGAGSGACLEAYADLQLQRLHLIEGDTDSADAISTAVAGNPAIDVHPVVVAGSAGTVTWHRYNVRALNGPLAAQPLNTLFPRLRQLAAESRQAESVKELLQRLKPATNAGPNLLVIDMPGQELDVLAALGNPRALGFEHILVRAAGDGTYPGAKGIAPVAAELRAHHFAIRDSDSNSDPVWPALWLSFDEHAAAEAASVAEAEGIRHQIETLRQQAAASAAQKEALEGDKRKLIEDLASMREKLEGQSQTEAARSAEMAQLRAEKKVLQEQLAARLEQVAAAERAASEIKLQINGLIKDRDEQAKLATERAQQLELAKSAAAKSAADAKSQVDALARTRDDLTRLAGEHAAQLEQALQGKAAAENAAGATNAQVETLNKALAEQNAKLQAMGKSMEDREKAWVAERQKLIGERDTQRKEATEANTAADQQRAIAQLKHTELQHARQRNFELAESVRAVERDLVAQRARNEQLEREGVRLRGQLEILVDVMSARMQRPEAVSPAAAQKLTRKKIEKVKALTGPEAAIKTRVRSSKGERKSSPKPNVPSRRAAAAER